MRIDFKTVEQLSAIEVFELLKLRTSIFVVEQKCAYQEVDSHDRKALHVLAWKEKVLIGCARILPGGTAYEYPSIGRVAVDEKFRKEGFGREIFAAAIKKAMGLYPEQLIKIQAQCYLESFYQSFGFKTISQPYPDAGIMHVDMVRDPEK